jgi:hypothetical protein
MFLGNTNPYLSRFSLPVVNAFMFFFPPSISFQGASMFSPALRALTRDSWILFLLHHDCLFASLFAWSFETNLKSSPDCSLHRRFAMNSIYLLLHFSDTLCSSFFLSFFNSFIKEFSDSIAHSVKVSLLWELDAIFACFNASSFHSCCQSYFDRCSHSWRLLSMVLNFLSVLVNQNHGLLSSFDLSLFDTLHQVLPQRISHSVVPPVLLEQDSFFTSFDPRSSHSSCNCFLNIWR